VARARGHAGFTLIEVMASALIVVLLAVGTLAALEASTRESFQSRIRTDAQALAQQDEARLHGLSISELANLDKTVQGGTLDGVPFTIHEQATFVADSTQSASCSNPATDYVKTTSTVTWANMGASAPVVLSGIDTPPPAASATQGGLAVTVSGAGGAGVGGMTVTISGPQSATMLSDSNGCALFGGLTPGTYTVSVYSYGPTFTDQTTGINVTTSTPDVTSQGVAAGSISGAQLTLAPPGAINYTFVSTSGNPAGVAAGAIGVVAYNSLMGGNHLRSCTLANGSLCPPAGSSDTKFPATDWPQIAGVSTVAATPLAPYSSAYTAYAGVCSANDPASYSGTDKTATVQSNLGTNVQVTVPAMVIHVWNNSKTNGSSLETAPSHVYIKDTGCNVRYTGYLQGQTPPTVTAGQSPMQAVVPLNRNYPTSTTGGVLAYPGMPYGKYNICVDNGTSYWLQSYTNNDSTGAINFYEDQTTTGSVFSELGTGANQC
jgi:prepilin-type N-terminal cleavage/methylation domain-containing protein